jgi:uracil-DNA glycosylase family 4
MPYYQYKRKPKIPTFRPVSGEGPLPAELMLVGERPGIDEDIQGRPFVGLSGQELNRYMDSVNLRREDCYVTNVVKVYAEHSPKVEEVEEWQGLLELEIEQTRPVVIAAVGAYAARWFLGPVLMDEVHGIPHMCRFDCLVVPVYHPASAFYDTEQGRYVQYDFEMLAAAVRGEIGPRADAILEPRYSVLPPNISPSAPLIAIDTEGSREKPWCLTWSTDEGEAYCQREVHTGWSADGLVLLHNSLHDLGVLESMGITIPDGGFVDTMVLAYLLGVEPQGLKPLAHRHAGMRMQSYTDLLEAASESLAMEYLHGLSADKWGASEPYCIIKGGTMKIVQPNSLNRYIANILRDVENGKTNKTGYPVDPRKRWGNIDTTITRRAVDVFGDMPEATLDDIPESDAINYACRDADATLRIYPILQARVDETGQRLVQEIDHAIIPMVDRMQRNGFKVDPAHFERLIDKCDIIMAQCVIDIGRITGAKVNPDSPVQVRALLFDSDISPKIREAMGDFNPLDLDPIKWTKGGESGDRAESTQDKVIEALRYIDTTGCVARIADFREASKVRNSFCRPILQRMARTNSDGRLRCNLRITRVSSGRLAANSPNLMAIPVRSALGREVRAGFVAPEGRILATWDENQVEMRHMANESRDPALLQVYEDGKDLHQDTVDRLGTDRPMAKRINFGIITGITGVGLLDQTKLAGVKGYTQEICDELIERWFGVYRGVRGYMDASRAEARRYGYVRDMWGRVRYLPGVHSPISRISEEACRQSHSHKIQAGAQGIMKIAMAAIWHELKESIWPAGWYAEPLLQIHDEIVFELDDDPVLWAIMDDMVQRCLTTAHIEFMEAHSDYFTYSNMEYVVPLKAKGVRGPNWAALEK